MTHAGLPYNSDVQFLADAGGQVAVGNYQIQLQAGRGAVAYLATSETRPNVWARPTPVLLRPRDFPDLLDRLSEVEAVTAALESAQSLDFYGQQGLGKTALLHHLAHRQPDGLIGDGIIYLSARHQPVGDLCQSLFDAFYESDMPIKCTQAQIKQALQERKALVLLDDVELQREEIAELMNVAPACIFVMASEERRLWDEAQAMVIRGLPLVDCLTLIERVMGRALTPEEYAPAHALCAKVGGHPLRILQAAAIVRDEPRSLAEVVERLQGAPYPETVVEQAISLLPEFERRLLGMMAALSGAATTAEHLASLTILPNAAEILTTLERRGLVREDESRFSLTGNLDMVLQGTWDLTPWRERALYYFTSWAEENAQDPKQLLVESDAIQRTLEWALTAGRSADVLRFATAVQSAFALGGRWSAWQQVLESMLQAAREIKDNAAEALALHQLGTGALALDETTLARSYLSDALRIRESLGDAEGVVVTRHNMQFLPEALQAEAYPARPATAPVAKRSSLPRLLKWALLPIGLLLVAGLALRLTGMLPAEMWLAWLKTISGASEGQQALSVSGISVAATGTEIQPESLLFSIQEVNVKSQPQAVKLKNTGQEPIKISNVSVAGPNAGDFTITTDCADKAIAPGGECTINISFIPASGGDRAASLVITDDQGQGLQTVSLSGSGASASVGFSPAGVDFGSREVKTGADTRTVTITNSGSAPLRIGKVTLSGADARNFSVSAGDCLRAAIAPGASCAVSVKFAPSSARSFSAILNITDNTSNRVRSVPLSGTGASAAGSQPNDQQPDSTQAGGAQAESSDKDPTPPRGAPAVTANRTGLYFVNQRVGTRSAAQSLTLTNSGSAPLVVSGVSIEGAQARAFSISSDSCSRASVAPGASCSISVVFAPVEPTNPSALLSISTNAARGSLSVRLSGNSLSATPGWCCSNGKVKESTAEECLRLRGFFSEVKKEANKGCKEK